MAKRKSKPIVEGYLEKVSAGLLQKFSTAVTEHIKDKQGIYALYRNNNLYYVGLATDLKRRLKQHLKDQHQGKWTHFSLYVISKSEHIKELESLLLRIAYPKGNSQKGKLKASENIKPTLERYVKNKQNEELKSIFSKPSTKQRPRKAKVSNPKHSKKTPKRSLLKAVQDGKLKGWQRLYAKYKGIDYKAMVRPNGEIERMDTKERFNSPSGAGRSIRGISTDGPAFWKVKINKELVRLKEIL